MNSERVYELEQLANDAIEEYQCLENITCNTSLAFWLGVKSVVDELIMENEIKKTAPTL